MRYTHLNYPSFVPNAHAYLFLLMERWVYYPGRPHRLRLTRRVNEDGYTVSLYTQWFTVQP